MTTNTNTTKSTKSTAKVENVAQASEGTTRGIGVFGALDTILANVSGYDESATRTAFTAAHVALEQVESGFILGTVRARQAMGAAVERFYVLQHGKSSESLTALVKAVPSDLTAGLSESSLKLAVRTYRLHTPERYVMWSDACGTDAATSDPAAFKRNADAYLRWAEAHNDKRTDASGRVLAPSAKSNRSGTGSKPAPLAGETTADYRKRLAAAEDAKRREHAARVMSADKVGGIKLTTFQSMPDAALGDVIVLCRTILAEREAAAKVAAAAAEQAKQAQNNVADALAGLSADDLAKLVALVKSA